MIITENLRDRQQSNRDANNLFFALVNTNIAPPLASHAYDLSRQSESFWSRRYKSTCNIRYSEQ